MRLDNGQEGHGVYEACSECMDSPLDYESAVGVVLEQPCGGHAHHKLEFVCTFVCEQLASAALVWC